MENLAQLVGGVLGAGLLVAVVALLIAAYTIPFAIWSAARSLRRIANHLESAGIAGGATRD